MIAALFQILARTNAPTWSARLMLCAAGALGGAVGGVLFHYLEPLRRQGNAWRIVANAAGVLAYLVVVAVTLALATQAGN